MLRKEQNDLLTQTGPGTPMGQLFRSYWLPALLAEELPENDCPPVRVKLLSERLIAFRDTDGRYGLIDEFCAHRGVSLWFGRNEECGLRCPYHGWKYDVTGQCIDVPSEPEESGFCQQDQAQVLSAGRARRRAVDLHGPAGEAAAAARSGNSPRCRPEQSFVSKRLQECNWLQAMEGGIDSSHVSFLHRGELNTDPLFKGAKGNQYNLGDARPVSRWSRARAASTSARAATPRTATTTGASRSGSCRLHDDPAARRSSGARPFLDPDRRRELLGLELRLSPDARADAEPKCTAMRDGKGIHVKYVPGTFRPLANKDNDYLMDRAAQKAGRTFSGVEGIAMQDASLQESMGPIVDRTKENLVSTDNGIIMARHRLLRAVKALVDKGVTPPGVDPAHQRVRSAAIVLPPDQPFKEARSEALMVQPGVAHASV